MGSHDRSHAVTNAGQDAGRTQGVTLLQTRPDQTRVVLTVVCGVSGQSSRSSHGDLREPPAIELEKAGR